MHHNPPCSSPIQPVQPDIDELLGDLWSRAFNYGSAQRPQDPTNDIEEAKAAIQSLLLAARSDIHKEGHFFTVKEMRGGAIDYGYYWFCKCGYKAKGKDELDGHIAWMLAELRAAQQTLLEGGHE